MVNTIKLVGCSSSCQEFKLCHCSQREIATDEVQEKRNVESSGYKSASVIALTGSGLSITQDG